MASLALSAEQRIDASPGAVFDLFGAGSGAGWVFDAACDRVAAGAAVTLRAPLGGPTGEPVEMLGRITRARPPGRNPGRIEIMLDVPWRGRLRVLFDADGLGTRVRIVADLDNEGLHWLMRRRGYPVRDDAPDSNHLVGLLTSKSGPGSVFAAATGNLAAMAVEEINSDGGIRGRPVRLMVGDDATDPVMGTVEARRLVHNGCRVIMVSTTSATFAHVADELRPDEVLLVHTVMNEGGLGGDLLVQLGERPYQQLRAAADPMMTLAGGRRWFLAGNDYVWPQCVHAAARRVVAEEHGQVVGEAFAPLGTRDFTPVIEAVLTSGADVVLSSFVGADLVAFERQCHAMGVRERARSLALALDEPTRERIGDAAGDGMWGVSGYFEQLPDEANKEFLHRYRQAFGAFAPPVSSISESVYESVHLYAAAARRAGEDEPRTVARELRRSRSDFPRGTVTVAGPETVRQQLFLAEATPGGFAVSPSR
ncbi:substrate-binding protein [Pseudonocardia sp.]|jgi:urea transport system substrate-binding protein|uniref:substrate-binding protein n=1 Tax=Pseudonocardia sp. TaxID=60912 RepID=UPI00262FC2AA|nr:substrate-binding protein [Pseudonocardia sp.]MCW2720161.1 Extracellular ligand-binding receptor [Pseudonocardia sp.]MDT7615939.1 urea transport system substrate-binding protein [Pseudonocardiales bacterium]